jgi:HAD superfamily hydrolase (TIGR01662 family)
VARGLFPEEALAPVFRKLDELLAARGITLAGHYYCPHHPRGVVPGYTEVCGCRKPESGMLLQAAREYDLDLGACWLVGDILDDVEAGRRAGCRTVLLDNGNETEWVMPPQRRPHAMARDLEEAAQLILAADALALGAGGTPLHAEGRAADGRQRACR